MDDYKIICFVNNDSVIYSSGLINVFNRVTNNFIKEFFYENAGTFSDFGRNKIKKFILIKQSSATKKISLEYNDDWDILLVSDDLEELPIQIFTKKSLVMYHDGGYFNVEKFWQNKRDTQNIFNFKKGQHIPSPYEGYQRLLDLTVAYNEDKTFDQEKYIAARKNILEWFGIHDKLNAALEFLHSCLAGTLPDDLSILTNKGFTEADLGIENTSGSIKNYFKNLKEIYNNKSKKEEYISSLTKLRDAVLEKLYLE